MLYYFMECLFLCFLCRTIALAATVICWMYPTLNKLYLILSYLTFSYLWFQALATGRSDQDLQFHYCGKSRGKVSTFSTNFVQVLILRFSHFCLWNIVMAWEQSPFYRSFVRWIHTGRLWGPLGPPPPPKKKKKGEGGGGLPVMRVFHVSFVLSVLFAGQGSSGWNAPLAQVMACCLATPSHFLNKYWHPII